MPKRSRTWPSSSPADRVVAGGIPAGDADGRSQGAVMAHRTIRARRRRHRRAAFGALSWLFVAGLVALAASSMFGGPVRLVVVRGHSMDPTFATGDLIVVESITAAQVGDVVSYPIEAGEGREAHVV